MPLRYVRVVLNYQEESPPISHWDRGVIPQGWAVASCDIGGLYSILEYIPLSETVAASPALYLVC